MSVGRVVDELGDELVVGGLVVVRPPLREAVDHALRQRGEKGVAHPGDHPVRVAAGLGGKAEIHHVRQGEIPQQALHIGIGGAREVAAADQQAPPDAASVAGLQSAQFAGVLDGFESQGPHTVCIMASYKAGKRSLMTAGRPPSKKQWVLSAVQTSLAPTRIV